MIHSMPRIESMFSRAQERPPRHHHQHLKTSFVNFRLNSTLDSPPENLSQTCWISWMVFLSAALSVTKHILKKMYVPIIQRVTKSP
mmetsp:Transcript_25169/g.37668  ORF Transcript_25169/g.37668 Transcript_25169/m.37668 type:complete len:86 (-) Transcript_25169:1983-2240(-)